MWEIALNHFVTRQAARLPETQKLALKIRPTDTDHHMALGNTHARGRRRRQVVVSRQSSVVSRQSSVVS